MTPSETINAALVSRGLRPARFTCLCCGDAYDDDERESHEWFLEPYASEVKRRFDGPLCKYCCVKMTFCAATDRPITPHDGTIYVDDIGVCLNDRDAWDAIEDARCTAAHNALLASGWRE